MSPANVFDNRSRLSVHRFRKTLGYVFPEWRMLLAILACTLGFTATAALDPWPMKLLVDYLAGDGGVPEAMKTVFDLTGLRATPTALVVVVALASLGLFAINSGLTVLMCLAWSLGGQRMVYALAGDLVGK